MSVSAAGSLDLGAPVSTPAAIAKQGQYDSRNVSRVIPVIEAMMAVTLANLMMLAKAQAPKLIC